MTLDDLYAADLTEFVAVRDQLVKELKAAGDKEGAAAVKALRKPSTVAWGVNRVVREHAVDVDELIEAAAAVRAAQVRAVQGDSGGLREASKGWRAKVQQLAAAVGKLVGPQYRDEAAATFEAASVDETLAEVLRSGRFTAAIAAAGFGLAGMPDPPATSDVLRTPAQPEHVKSPEEPEPEPEIDREAIAAAEAELATREKKVESALFRLRRAEQRLDQARAAVDDARVAHEETIAARDEAARALDDLTP